MNEFGDFAFVRLITDDAETLLPALAQCGVAFRLAGQRRVDVLGMAAADVARVAAIYNARVADLETVPSAAEAAPATP